LKKGESWSSHSLKTEVADEINYFGMSLDSIGMWEEQKGRAC